MKKSALFKPAALSAVIGLGAMMTMGTAFAGDSTTAMNQDTVSLLQAVATAKANTGGMPMEAERDVDMGQSIYEIELAGKNGETIFTAINSQTGAVIMTRTDDTTGHHHDCDEDDHLENSLWVSGVNNGQYISMENAVKQAENQYGGKAYSVEMDEHHNQFTYEVKLLTANGQK